MEKIFEFKKGEVFESVYDEPNLRLDLLYEVAELRKDIDVRREKATILRDFTITIKIDYKDNH